MAIIWRCRSDWQRSNHPNTVDGLGLGARRPRLQRGGQRFQRRSFGLWLQDVAFAPSRSASFTVFIAFSDESMITVTSGECCLICWQHLQPGHHPQVHVEHHQFGLVLREQRQRCAPSPASQQVSTPDSPTQADIGRACASSSTIRGWSSGACAGASRNIARGFKAPLLRPDDVARRYRSHPFVTKHRVIRRLCTIRGREPCASRRRRVRRAPRAAPHPACGANTSRSPARRRARAAAARAG